MLNSDVILGHLTKNLFFLKMLKLTCFAQQKYITTDRPTTNSKKH